MDDRWLSIEAKRRGRPYWAAIRLPFDAALWPAYDHHVAVALPYRPHWRTGLPKPAELTRVQAFEDRMIEQLEGHGVVVASETGEAQRVIHAYVRGGGPVVAMYRETGIATVTHDPGWARVAHLSELAARAAA